MFELKLLTNPAVATVVIPDTDFFFNSVINKLQGTCLFFRVVTKLCKNPFSVKFAH